MDNYKINAVDNQKITSYIIILIVELLVFVGLYIFVPNGYLGTIPILAIWILMAIFTFAYSLMIIDEHTLIIKDNKIYVTSWGNQLLKVSKYKVYPLQNISVVISNNPGYRGMSFGIIYLWNDSHTKQDAVVFYLTSRKKLEEEINNSKISPSVPS